MAGRLGGHVPDGLAQRVGVADHARLRRLADPPPRRVDDAPEGHGVGGVHEHRQVGQGVLDLGALVEAGAADHLVGDAVAHQVVLEHPRLGVGPVEDRHVVARRALVHQPLDLGHHEASLGVLVVELAHVHRVALTDVRPQRLDLARAVVGDDRVGRVENRLRRAVVLLELDHVGVRPVVFEVEDVADVGSAEGVDGVVGHQPGRDVVVGALDIQVVDRRVDVHRFDPLDEIERSVRGEHGHAGPDRGGGQERQRVLSASACGPVTEPRHLAHEHRSRGLYPVHRRHGFAVALEAGFVAPALGASLRRPNAQSKRLEGPANLRIPAPQRDQVHGGPASSVTAEGHRDTAAPALESLRRVMRMVKAQAVVGQQLQPRRESRKAREDAVGQGLVGAQAPVEILSLGLERKGGQAIPQREFELRGPRLRLGLVRGDDPRGVGPLLHGPEVHSAHDARSRSG